MRFELVSVMRALKEERLFLSLTGMRVSEFKGLAETFKKVLLSDLSQRNRQRAVGGGRKGALKDVESKLFYILFYLKVYPTYDLAGFIFEVDRSRCFHWTVRLMPLLEKALGRHVALPKRQIRSAEEFMALCPDVKDLFLHGTERPTQRPQKSKLRKAIPERKDVIPARAVSSPMNAERFCLSLRPKKGVCMI